MEKESFKKLLSQTAQGKFNAVKDAIISQQLKLNDTQAAKVVVECCRILYKDEQSACETDLFNLLKICIKFIGFITEELSLHYFQSVFFITKFFIKKNRCDIIIKMESVFLPSFIGHIKVPTISKVHSSICNILHNSICKNISQKISFPITRMCGLVLKLRSFHVAVAELLGSYAYGYFSAPPFVNSPVDIQCQCYDGLLQHVLDKVKLTNEEKTAEAVIKILNTITSNLHKVDADDKIEQYVKTGISIISKLNMTKKYSKLIDIFQYCLVLVAAKNNTQVYSNHLTANLKKCLNALKKISKPHSISTEICHLLLSLLSNFLKHYQQDCKMTLGKEAELTLCKLLGEVLQISSRNKTVCPFCTNCQLDINISTAGKATTLIGNILSMCVKGQKDSMGVVCGVALNSFDHCCKMILKIQEANCTSWKRWWEQVATIIYSIGLKLYHLNRTECCDYWTFLIRNTLCLERTATSQVFKQDVVLTGLTCLHENHRSRLQFKKALMYAAVSVLLRSEADESCFRYWIAVKYDIKKQDISTDLELINLTSVCVLEREANAILEFCADLKPYLDKMDPVKMLLMELRHYKSSWPSKIVMAYTLRKIFQTADISITVEVLIKTWANNLELVTQELIELLPEIRTKFETSRSKDQLQTAFLYALQYYFDVTTAKQQIARSITDTLVPEKQYEVGDKDDECVMLSSYANWNLDKYLEIVQYLNKSMLLFDNLVSESTPKCIAEKLEEMNVLEFIMKIAYEFRLHCNSVQETYAWVTCLKISRLLNNKLYVLKSISFILEKSSETWDGLEELVKEADLLSASLKDLSIEDEVYQEVLIMYHINKSKMLLRHKDFRAGITEYDKAVCFSKTARKNGLLEVLLQFLHVQYLWLPCEMEIEGHTDLFEFSNIQRDVNTYIKEEAAGSPAIGIATLFEINEFIVNTYIWMSLPREARCFSRETLKFAQQQVLPIRTAYILISYARSDLQSNRLDDYKEKLNRIANILCLDNSSFDCAKSPVEEALCVDISLQIDEDVDVARGFPEIVLECPIGNDQELRGSPILYEEPFKVPWFLKHPFNCDCFYCTSVEYMSLVLMFLELKAQLYVNSENLKAADFAFKGVLYVYEQIVKRGEKYRSYVSECLGCYPFTDLENYLWKSRSILLLDYGNYLIQTKCTLQAQDINEALINVINPRKYDNPFLYNEAHYQKLVMEMILQDGNGHNNQVEHSNSNEELNDKDDINILKTPKNRAIKVIVSPNAGEDLKCYSYVIQRPKLKLVFSPCKSDSENCKNSQDKRSPSPISKNQNSTKDDGELLKMVPYKTPACPLKVRLPPNVPQDAEFTDKNEKCNLQEESESIIDGSPEAFVTNSAKLSRILRSRTRLLTKKLQKSTQKEAPAKTRKQRKNCENKATKLCTNLLKELCAADDSEKEEK